MTATMPKSNDPIVENSGAALPADLDRADRAASLRAFRLTRAALPSMSPTRMPPQQIEFWHPRLFSAISDWTRVVLRRPAVSITADAGRS